MEPKTFQKATINGQSKSPLTTTTPAIFHFGVIETQLVRTFQAFPTNSAIALTTSGYFSQMTCLNPLPNYDNKTYVCELDMEEGTFTISYNSTIIAKQNCDIRGKTVVPFAFLFQPGKFGETTSYWISLREVA